MMSFPHAAKGVKKIFSAEVLSLLAAIASGIVMILVIVLTAAATQQSETTEGISLVGIMLFGGAALIIAIIGAVMNVVGYIQAAIDESGFRRAIVCTILSIVFTVVWSLLQNQTGFLGWLGTAFYAASQIAQLLVSIFAIGGLMNLSAQCSRPDLVHKGRNILRVLTAIYVLSLIAIILTRVFSENGVTTALVVATSVTILILSVVEYILYLSYLAKCSRMLNENNNHSGNWIYDTNAFRNGQIR
ncbi:MAG: hypothetical protein IJH32_04295 [Ruminococcus sp.]|nr:hypothetical protein [Ruminococcus sp.]